MPADTYIEPHWFTGKLKLRCLECEKVVFKTEAEAQHRAAQISERRPMIAYLGKCGHYHVSRKRRRD